MLVAVSARPLATDDTWWHLAMGRFYASGGLFADADPLLHSAGGREPVPHEWLFQVALHGAHELAGFAGLRVLHALAVAGIVAGAFALLWRAAGGVALASLATLVLVHLSWFRWMQLRPELWSTAAVGLLYVLVLYVRSPDPAAGRAPEATPGVARIAAALALMVVWVNVHSLFAVGLALLIAALLGAGLFAALARAARDAAGHPALEENARLARCWAALLVAALVATGANPRGWHAHVLFFRESRAGSIWQLRDDFLPWHPLVPAVDNPAFSPLSWALATALLCAVGVAVLARVLRFVSTRRVADLRALDPVHAGLAAAAFAAGFVSVRFHWLLFFPLLYLLRARPQRTHAREWGLAATAALLAMALPMANGFAAFAREVAREPAGYWRASWLDHRYAGDGMRFLRDAGLSGRLYNPFNLGGFLGYWLAPRMRTFIDGRLDHVPPRVLDDYLTVRRSSRSGPSIPLRHLLDEYGVDVFFADAFPEREYAGRQSGLHLRRLPEWIPAFVADTHAVYVRRAAAPGVPGADPRGATRESNLDLAETWWWERGVRFDRRRGLDVDAAARAAPEQARRLGWEPPAAWVAARGDSDPLVRAGALAALGEHYWRIGWFERSIDADRELARLLPDAFEPRRRLTDALLQSGRPRAALGAARALRRDFPDEPEATYLLRTARLAVQAARERRVRSE